MAAPVHQINGKQLVMQVLLDAAGNYSVCGYADRMKTAFGQIFLGRDATDPQYQPESAAAVAAIGSIAEQQAFDLALQTTRMVMQPLAGKSTFNMTDISDEVLAAICTLWFDLPDGDCVVAGSTPVPLPFMSSRCPGFFGPPSGYIFQPEPGAILSQLGQMDGARLREDVAKFVAKHRSAGTAPGGVISSALFAAFPNSPADDDLLTRTLIGVMMGFLPTAQGNLKTIATVWEGSTFRQVRGAYAGSPESDLFKRANQVFRDDMVKAMQAGPMPPAIWRTSLRDHSIGNPPLQIKAGDLLYINLDSATREDLAAGIVDPMPIFGGDRSLIARPTHACPGFKAAMGVLLGIVAGTLESGLDLKT